MRKKQTATIRTGLKESTLQGYHQGIFGNESYAFSGFKSNKYFTSDRTIDLDEQFRRKDGKDCKGFGLEIESECTSINDSIIYAHILKNMIINVLPDDLFKFQRDSSLGGLSSAEMITQIMTKEFIRNNYPNFYQMFKRLESIKAGCGSINCGMHVNMSNALFGNEKQRKENILKLVYFVNKNYRLSCNLFKRNASHTGYCQRLNYNFNSFKEFKENVKNISLNSIATSHSECFNLSHYNAGRIELRIVGGQPNFQAFRNTMEVVFHLIEAVKTLKGDQLDDLKLVFNNCNKYVLSRLKDCRDSGSLDLDVFNEIKANSDKETVLYDVNNLQ